MADLTPEIIKKFKTSMIFEEENARITSTDFSFNGKFFIASDSNNILWCDALKGKKLSSVSCRKYGVDLIKYTHLNHQIIHSSKKLNNDIRLLDLKERKYKNYYRGHERPVSSLAVCCCDDKFASASQDRTVRLWGFNVEEHSALLHSSIVEPVAEYDMTGIYLYIGFKDNTIFIYDLRKFFEESKFVRKIKLKEEKDLTLTGFSISKDNQKILINTNQNKLLLYTINGDHIGDLTGKL